MKPVESIDADEMKSRFSSILHDVSNDQSFIILDQGEVVAELVQTPHKTPQPGCLKGFVTNVSDDFDDTHEGFENYPK